MYKRQPKDLNKFIIVLISFTLGKFFNTTGLLKSIVAAKIGSEEFFDPEISTSPLILLGPSIENLSINYFLIFAT